MDSIPHENDNYACSTPLSRALAAIRFLLSAITSGTNLYKHEDGQDGPSFVPEGTETPTAAS